LPWGKKLPRFWGGTHASGLFSRGSFGLRRFPFPTVKCVVKNQIIRRQRTTLEGAPNYSSKKGREGGHPKNYLIADKEEGRSVKGAMQASEPREGGAYDLGKTHL